MCTLTSSVKFSVPNYVNMMRIHGPKKDWTDLVWNKFTHFRVIAFMWKVFWGALPVDRNIQRRGIHLVSKCVCCSYPTVETKEHLFIHSDIARYIWDHFAARLQKARHFSPSTTYAAFSFMALIEERSSVIRLWQSCFKEYGKFGK